MTNAKRQNPKPFAPVKGHIYENAGGGRYLCEDPEATAEAAWMMNIASGWMCQAKSIVRYDDNMIEWDRSTGGYFLPIDDRKRQEIYEAIELEAYARGNERRQRSRSMMNAMLCCFI